MRTRTLSTRTPTIAAVSTAVFTVFCAVVCTLKWMNRAANGTKTLTKISNTVVPVTSDGLSTTLTRRSNERNNVKKIAYSESSYREKWGGDGGARNG